MHYLI